MTDKLKGNTKSTAIIQVRLLSTRLESKALLPLSGKPLIFHVIERVKRIENIEDVVLATGNAVDNSPLKKIASDTDILFFEGPEDNVLNRFHLVSEMYPSHYFIRATGDNPLIDFNSASRALFHSIENSLDHCYISNMPTGTGIEVISSKSLSEANKMAKRNYEFEHVTPYIKENPESFKLGTFDNNCSVHSKYRLTVDTEIDYELLKAIYNELYSGEPIEISSVFKFLETNPELANINGHIEQRPANHSNMK